MKSEIVPMGDVLAALNTNESAKNAMLASIDAVHELEENGEISEKTRHKLASCSSGFHAAMEWRERTSAVAKRIGEITEFVCNVTAIDGFHWQKTGATKNVTDLAALAKRASEDGHCGIDAFLSIAKVSVKDAAECCGMSEQAILESYGDLCEVKEKKPALKRDYQ
jgi:hypothetical protein